VAPKSEAEVTLNRHVNIASETGASDFVVLIVEGSCTGEVIGAGGWSGSIEGTNTISVTGLVVVSVDNTYHLCAVKGNGGAVNGTAVQRCLTANWMPTAYGQLDAHRLTLARQTRMALHSEVEGHLHAPVTPLANNTAIRSAQVQQWLQNGCGYRTPSRHHRP
jgi:hypothetical protein